MATKEARQAADKPTAPQYTPAELANAAQKVFGVPQDVVTAALRMAGIRSATIEEAKRVVMDFARKEVK